MDEEVLRQKAHEVVRDGKLPSRRPDRTWGGPDVGADCSVCGLPVTEDQMEFDIQFAHDGSSPGLDKYHVHVRGFAAWELERESTSTGRGRSTEAKDEAAAIVAAVADARLCLRCITTTWGISEDEVDNAINRIRRGITISAVDGVCENCGQSTATYKLG
jgi:hypothetical protein